MKIRTFTVCFVSFLVLFNFSALCDAFRMVSGQLTQAGIYEAASVQKVDAPETDTGYTSNATGLKLVKTTDDIPARLGLIFGFEYVLIGLEPNKSFSLKRIISHPKITKPDGSVSEGYEMMVTKQADAFGTLKDIQGYIFNEAYEVKPGEWKFTIVYQDQKLIEKTFHVVKE